MSTIPGPLVLTIPCNFKITPELRPDSTSGDTFTLFHPKLSRGSVVL